MNKRWLDLTSGSR